MKLSSLIRGIDNIQLKGPRSVEVKGIVSHSKMVFPGALFLALKGAQDDGNHFISQAIDSGASVVVSDMYNPVYTQITQLIYKDPKALEEILLERFYHQPSSDLMMFGVTGTNGKTTTTLMIYHILKKAGLKVGLGGSDSVNFKSTSWASSDGPAFI